MEEDSLAAGKRASSLHIKEMDVCFYIKSLSWLNV